jgi:hypothetical protein
LLAGRIASKHSALHCDTPALLQLPVNAYELHPFITQQSCCCPDLWVDCAGVDLVHAAGLACILHTLLLLLQQLLSLQLPLMLCQTLILPNISQSLMWLETLGIHLAVAASQL